MFGVMLILPIHCIATTSARSQVIWKASWYLESQVSGKLCPWSLPLPTHVLINHNDLHRLILMGSNRLPQFWLSLYLVYHWNIFGYYLLLLYMDLGMDIHYSWLLFYYLFIITVHVKIIMLMGTWSDHPGKQCYHKGLMGRPWLIN